MDRKWWKESVIYEIYPRSFCDSNGDGIGDLKGITGRLDYLAELGVDVIWLCPIYQSPNDDNGYDISDYRAIMREFGTMEDFDELLAQAHARGIRVLMDLVVNHTSDEHVWFAESRSSKDNPYRDYYIWRPAKEDGGPPSNWGSAFSGSAWEYDAATDMYYLHLFSRKQPDLNWRNPDVRRDVFEMMNWWLDKGIDGWRMDTISLISKPEEFQDSPPKNTGYADCNSAANGPHVHEYLREMRQAVLNRADTLSVGECAGVTIEEARRYASSDGTELNMAFQFEHMAVDDENGTKWTLRKMDLRDMKRVMTAWQKGLEGVAWNSLFWCNHDQPRCVSRYGDDSPAFRERSAKMLATCLHLMQGTPFIYQGEELGMTNVPFGDIGDFRDIESINAYTELQEAGIYTKEEVLEVLRYKSRDNARTPMQWDAGVSAGFTAGTPWIMVNPNYREINAAEQLGREDSVFRYYQKLIRLRRENEIVVYGTYDLLLPEDPDLYVYTRTLGEEQLLIVCSFTGRERTLALPAGYAGAPTLLSNYEESLPGEEIRVRPWEAFVRRRL